MEDLALRLARLETECAHLRRTTRRWSVAAGALALTASFGLLAGFSARPAPADILEAKRIVVVDDAGKPLLTLGRDEDGGRLELMSAGGKEMLNLTCDADGGMLNVLGTAGKEVAGFYVDSDGGNLTLADSAGKPMVMGTTDADGGLFLINGKGSEEPRVTQGVDEEQNGFVATFDREGEGSGGLGGGSEEDAAALPRQKHGTIGKER